MDVFWIIGYPKIITWNLNYPMLSNQLDYVNESGWLQGFQFEWMRLFSLTWEDHVSWFTQLIKLKIHLTLVIPTTVICIFFLQNIYVVFSHVSNVSSNQTSINYYYWQDCCPNSDSPREPWSSLSLQQPCKWYLFIS